MRKLRIVLCEDDSIQCELYTELCREVSKKNRVDIEMKVYRSGSDFLFDLEDPKFYSTLDILLLDIHMPGVCGVETAREAREIGFGGVIIFITASKEHYANAFDVGAFHYITKGEHDFERFEEILLKAFKQAKNMRQEVIVLSCGGEIKQIEIQKIEYFEIFQRMLTVYYGDEIFEFISTLEKLENQLAGHGFQRIHRCYLVSLSHIKKLSYTGVTMQNGVVLPVGRKYYPFLKEYVEKGIVHRHSAHE